MGAEFLGFRFSGNRLLGFFFVVHNDFFTNLGRTVAHVMNERNTITALSCGAGQVKIRLTRGLLCPAKEEAVHSLKWP